MRTSVASAEARESLVGLVRPWVEGPAGGACAVAVRASISGWLTVVRDDSGAVHLLAAVRGSAPREDDALAASLLGEANGAVVPLRVDAARSVRRAVREWMSRHRSAAIAGVSSGNALRRLLALLDRGIGTAPLHERAALQRRAARLRAMLAGCHGAGMERMLAEAPADCSVVDLLDWLEINAGPAARDDARWPRPRRARMLALLVLE
jgi:hypothetical protein